MSTLIDQNTIHSIQFDSYNTPDTLDRIIYDTIHSLELHNLHIDYHETKNGLDVFTIQGDKTNFIQIISYENYKLQIIQLIQKPIIKWLTAQLTQVFQQHKEDPNAKYIPQSYIQWSMIYRPISPIFCQAIDQLEKEQEHNSYPTLDPAYPDYNALRTLNCL